MGKSLVVARDLPAGHVLTAGDIVMKSPGGGIPPYESPEGARAGHAESHPRRRLPLVRDAGQAERRARAFVTNAFFRLDNQTAVVTGACGKLGPVWAEALLDAGARVAALELAGAPAFQLGTGRSDDRSRDRIRRFDCDVTDRVVHPAGYRRGGRSTRRAVDPHQQRGHRPTTGLRRSSDVPNRAAGDRPVPSNGRSEPSRHLPGHTGDWRTDG